jgi:hypothetical protein
MNSLTRPSRDKPLNREDLLRLIETAFSVGEYRYARRIALSWLAWYPGDLPISLLHAQAFFQEGLYRQTLPILENLSQIDPEYVEVYPLISQTQQRLGKETFYEAEAAGIALGSRPSASTKVPKWATLVREARKVAKLIESQNDPTPEGTQQAEALIHQALVENSNHPLVGVQHLNLMLKHEDIPAEAIRSLAQAYHERWPQCLQFMLVLADQWMDGGLADQAVSYLHKVASRDVTGQVATRLWGESHPYKEIWPIDLSAAPGTPHSPQELPIPAGISAIMGWNQLPPSVSEMFTSDDDGIAQEALLVATPELSESSGRLETKPKHKRSSHGHYQPPETLISMQDDLERIAGQIKLPALARTDGRFPIYVIFTNRTALNKKFGEKAAALIDLEMRQVALAVSRYKSWGSMLYYADEPLMSPGKEMGELKPTAADDPWELKLALTDLDAVLGKRGEMIGAVLIVGGADIVPFHRLPNPVDDFDADILSDNPYATRDENYFIPEWAVGRLPDSNSHDPLFLLDSLNRIKIEHQLHSIQQPWYSRLWKKVKMVISRLVKGKDFDKHSFGYSAEIWRRASLSVFRPIGEPRELLISPPLHTRPSCEGEASSNLNNPCLKLPPARLGYFNLHGLPDAEEWYGQRDPATPGEGPDFPVALHPEDISGLKGLGIPQVVFSEACYGAYIQGKTPDQSIALRLLESGSHAVVGSTATSYGSITTPLIAADLLGKVFWTYLNDGQSAGEALRRSKIALAREMHRRQGYLDGEDQKTLISFILYGDPLSFTLNNGRAPKGLLRPLAMPASVAIVCDRQDENDQTQPDIPSEVITQVKHIVAQYLPGMKDAQVCYTHERSTCTGHQCPSSQLGAKTTPQASPNRHVVTLSKSIQQMDITHRQLARVTLDENGKIVKLAVSR